jgi:hypothetical protein
MHHHRFCLALAALAVAGTVSACGESSGVTSPRSSGNVVSQTSSTRARHRRRSQRHHRRRSRHHSTTTNSRRRARAGRLVVSGASAHSVQAQPAPGSCRARGFGLYAEPDPACTPGALNPAVTQATIAQTICVSGWTETVRPSESVTEPEKVASLAAYGDSGSPHEYEYDHLVSLELGGALNDARNLWPEPGASPNPKDSVENALHRMVCDDQLQLTQAQHIIATNWVSWAKSHTSPASTSTSTQTARSPATASGPDKPIADVNCSDFATHAAAQQWFEQHGGSKTNDIAGLDGNANGLACESLP